MITFDFPYTAAGRRAPDRNDVLEAAMRAAIAAAAERANKTKTALFVGGKSMGGRIASQVAAQDATGIAGLVFLGYPLHPPGKATQRRDAHLPAVKAPMLFVQGTRDPFGGPGEIAPIVKKLAKGSRVCVVEGGDHSHAVPKRAGVAQAEVDAGIAEAIVGFVDAQRR